MKLSRKPPVQRAFTGLVGLPPEPEKRPETSVKTQIDVVAPEYRSTADLVADIEKERREKRAAAARARRKLHADQIKRVKEVLKIPIAQVKAEAAAKAAAEKRLSMSAGAYMPEAPTSKGKIVTGGYDSSKIDYMTGLDVGEEATLGSGVASDQAEGGRRHGTPEGNAPEKDFNRDEAEFNLRSREGMHGWTESGSRGFQVRLTSDAEYDTQRALVYLLDEYFEDSVCRLCHVDCQDVEDAKDHILAFHGDEREPNHDARFGDIVGPKVKKIRREDRKRQKEGKKILAAAQPEKKIRATPEESDREGWEQTGPLIQVAGKGWVQEWVRKKPVTG
jgi:hypothetical protein